MDYIEKLNYSKTRFANGQTSEGLYEFTNSGDWKCSRSNFDFLQSNCKEAWGIVYDLSHENIKLKEKLNKYKSEEIKTKMPAILAQLKNILDENDLTTEDFCKFLIADGEY